MDTQANIDSTVNEFENEFNRFFDEKMREPYNDVRSAAL